MLYVDGAIHAKFVDASTAFVYVFFALGRAVNFLIKGALVVSMHLGLLKQRTYNQCIAHAAIEQAVWKR